jgi:predicted AlkP superfamily phosphohydrolase/phosphomutase
MTVPQTSRVLVIGLDVGDGKLIRQWIEEGYLPVLSSLLAQGTWGWLTTPAEVLHISAWPSLYTGTMPGKHGVYYPFQPCPGLQGVCRIGPSHYGQPPIWKLVAEAGRQCLVFDAPYTFPVQGFQGLQIFDWGTWAWYWKPMASPASIWRMLKQRYGPYPVKFEANQIGLATLDLVDLRRCLLQGIALKGEAVRWLLSEFSWDLFWVVFGETHPAAHYFWSQDSAAPDAGPSSLRDVYVAIDQAIGDILAGLGHEVTVFIVSGDGVGPNYAGWHLLPELLRKMHYTAPQELGANDNPTGKGKDVVKSLRDLVPLQLRQAVSRRLPTAWRDALMARWAISHIVWDRTRAFCLPTDLEGCIRINLRGREPHGIVAPGNEYEQVCEALIDQLQQLRNPQTQNPAVQYIVRTDRSFAGERQPYLPDLIVTWANEAPITELYAPETGTVAGVSPDGRTGTHRPPGFVLACGPNVPHGQVLASGHAVDFAPTLLATLGLSQPEYMDGCAWCF